MRKYAVRYGVPMEAADNMPFSALVDMLRYDGARVLGEKEGYLWLETTLLDGPVVDRWASFGVHGIRMTNEYGAILPEHTPAWEARFKVA